MHKQSTDTIRAHVEALAELLELARLAATCCDQPDDRMYHAQDSTWWRRNGNYWTSADSPSVVAAAPELLECAKMLVVVCTENPLPNTPERASILQQALAAIAKAEGQNHEA